MRNTTYRKNNHAQETLHWPYRAIVTVRYREKEGLGCAALKNGTTRRSSNKNENLVVCPCRNEDLKWTRMRTKKKLLATSKLWSTTIAPNNTPLHSSAARSRPQVFWTVTTYIFGSVSSALLDPRSGTFAHSQSLRRICRLEGTSSLPKREKWFIASSSSSRQLKSVSTVNHFCAVAIFLPH